MPGCCSRPWDRRFHGGNPYDTVACKSPELRKDHCISEVFTSSTLTLSFPDAIQISCSQSKQTNPKSEKLFLGNSFTLAKLPRLLRVSLVQKHGRIARIRRLAEAKENSTNQRSTSVLEDFFGGPEALEYSILLCTIANYHHQSYYTT